MKDKRVSIQEAASAIGNGCRLVMGGMVLQRQPMALVYELVRRGVRDLTVATFVGGNAIDLLVGVGAVQRIEAAYMGMGPFGFAPHFRKAVEAGRVEVDDISESAMMARFKAAGAGVPFLPHRSLLGTDMPKYSRHVREITCPFTGQPLHAVRALESDVTILHAHVADAYGNVQFPLQRNTDELDQVFAKAAKTLIVTVERIIPHEEVLSRSTQTIIPFHWVDMVVEVPYGAHPGSVDGLYREDEAHLRRYVEAAKTPEAFRAYLDEFVTGVQDHWQYLERIGGLRHLSSLHE